MAGFGLILQLRTSAVMPGIMALVLVVFASCSIDMSEMMAEDHNYILSYKGSIVVTDVPRRLEEGTEQKIKLRLSQAPEDSYRVTITSSHARLLVDGKQEQSYTFDVHNYDQMRSITLTNVKDDNVLRENYSIAIRSADTSEEIYNIISLDKDLPFIVRPSLTTGLNRPKKMVVEDFDNDGRPDLAVPNKYLETLALYRNITSASEVAFVHEEDLSNETSAEDQYFALAGDLDGDGDADIVNLVDDGSNYVDIYIADNGYVSQGGWGFDPLRGSFDSGDFNPNLTGARFGEILDIDGDGFLEIVVLDKGNDVGRIIFFDHQGQYLGDDKEIDIDNDPNDNQVPKSFVFKDFDGDGKGDFAVAQFLGQSVTLIAGEDPGSLDFSVQRSVLSSAGFVRDVAAGDIDGDGKVDLVATNYTSNSFSIFHNQSEPGSFSFGGSIEVGAGSLPSIIELADLTGDGLPEVLVSNKGDKSLGLYINISTPGNIAFYEAVHLDTETQPFYFVVADLNGDGLKDIVVANEGSDSISVFQNASPN